MLFSAQRGALCNSPTLSIRNIFEIILAPHSVQKLCRKNNVGAECRRWDVIELHMRETSSLTDDEI
jgi:hypothetical protein